MEELITSLKKDIIQQLNLNQFTPEQIDSDDPLFGGGLGLDSIDALEIIVLIDKIYGVKISSPEEARNVLTSIRNIAQYIKSKKA
jgi:acyl carrier protein